VASELKSRLQADLNAARKDRDKFRTLVISTALSDIRNKELEPPVGALDDEAVVLVLTRMIKQRRDAADQFRSAGRPELAEQEEAQATVLQEYLPEAMGEDEVRAIVREIVASGVDQMGQLMGQLMPRIRGRYDGKDANRIVREELAG
jgi:uncharacterized protein YqeY